MSLSLAKVVKTEPLPEAEAAWTKLVKSTYTDPKGRSRTWEHAERRTRPKGSDIDGVGILAILEKSTGPEVLLQKQFRPPLDKVVIEVPAGLIDAGETAEEAAVRELKEETGYVGTASETSPVMFNDPGFCNTNLRMIHVVVDLSLPENQPDGLKPELEENEFIETFSVPLSTFWEECKKLEAEGYAIDARISRIIADPAMASTADLPPLPLPEGISEHYITTKDLTFHTLEAGFSASQAKPLILLLHGFPELAYSYRKIIPTLAAAGYYVVAYDQRGYGRTTGWDTRPYSEVDLTSFAATRIVTDALRLVSAIGYREVACVVGHDFGAVGASLCALIRPDIFKSTVLMSHPFRGVPAFQFDSYRNPASPTPAKEDIEATLAGLDPPRKPYKWYYSTKPACQEMTFAAAGIHSFLRGYFHLKSADWGGNAPHPLSAWTASELAKLPNYYVMPLHSSMSETVARDMAQEDVADVERKAGRWLPNSELAVYAAEFARTSFQGGLNYYRVATNPVYQADTAVFAGKKIEVPSLFISGSKDWGTYQVPGAVEGMSEACTDFRGVKIVDGAGHWVMQERPDEVSALILKFLG
ncbi:hypothetical protein V492_03171 [Pseudogymnoascus sp. VKM F-4246]|nr:hypothetical protein V492_03171 [Pseudogymnoascus sp. VKM F-4246]